LGPVTSAGTIRYNHPEDLEAALKAHGDEVAGFIVEPIQGEAGIFVPDDGYLTRCAELCKQYNVLFIVDEIQTGLARTGKMLCSEWDNVLANKEVMLCIKPGEHGSTYGGNPLGCAVAMTALDVLVDEKLVDRAERLGEIFRSEVRKIDSPLIKLVRGRGLLNAIIIDESASKKGRTAWQLCLLMKSKG
jgi:ornithine--oxo-acid transaminase